MTSSLPIIDVSSFATGTDPATRDAAVGEAIDRACCETGFLLIDGHGVRPETKAAMLEQVRWFFSLPLEDKMEISIAKSSCHRGYVALAAETLDDAHTMAGDLKEAIDSGIDHPDDHPDVLAGTPLFGRNQLPDKAEFRAAYQAYHDEVVEAAERVQRAMARALGMDDDFIVGLGETIYNLRFVHYPAQAALPPSDGQFGCGAHTDYGSVTLLADDGVGGLQVMHRDGTWLDISVPDGLLVVNIGDLMAIWTNDRWVSNPHRVVNPPNQDRYSIPMFVTPPYHAWIECLPTCLGENASATYAPMQAGPYLLSRFDATHGYRNALLDEHNASVTSAYR
jgi:isopenicillin N synthase-like dioxygenase